MPRGVTTLESIVANIRMESHRSPDRNFGKDQYASIAHLARRVQHFLYWDYDWPFLKAERTIDLVAGQRFYDAPDDMNFERIFRVRTNSSGIWTDLERGIDVVHDYNDFDPDDDERSSPALRWDIVNTEDPNGSPVNDDQIEIWPIPEAAATLKLYGILSLGPFVSDNDVCTLDNTLIELFAAAEMLAGDERSDAAAKQRTAMRLYSKMRHGAARRTPGNSFSLGGGDPSIRAHRPVRVIAPQNAQ